MASNPMKPGHFGPPPGMAFVPPAPRAPLAVAEEKAETLLHMIRDIDAALHRCTPGDPEREALKARKAELLPRYRSAKEHVKELRRQANASPSPRAGALPPRGGPEALVDVLRHVEILRKLYGALSEVLERGALDMLTDDESASIGAFLDWWEGSA